MLHSSLHVTIKVDEGGDIPAVPGVIAVGDSDFAIGKVYTHT